MKIILLDTSDSFGGAAIACNRLMQALRKTGIDAKMLVRDKMTNEENVVSVNIGLSKRVNKFRFVWERFIFWKNNGFSRKNLFAVSLANTGCDISRHPLIKDADIIHLHWINQGFLSLKSIRKLLSIGKPIIWTMHDMWPCTGICHHARECDGYQKECHNCQFVQGGRNRKDISYKYFYKKKDLIWGNAISFVACSRWLGDRTKKSAIVDGRIEVIPNPIDTDSFRIKNKRESRKAIFQDSIFDNKFIILFGAAKNADKRKGIEYMIKACEILSGKISKTELYFGIVIFGKNAADFVDMFPFPVYPLHYISDQNTLVDLYNAVDVYVTPSLEENLPNTIMEAMSCGTPCVGFDIGGIPEMIDHQENGYVSRYKDADDLAKGIYWIYNNADYDMLSINARNKVIRYYQEHIVAQQYISLYESLLTPPCPSFPS